MRGETGDKRERERRHVGGEEGGTEEVGVTFLLMMELRTTQGRPLSCSGESWEGSWKMNTVVTSVAERDRVRRRGRNGVCVCVCV